MSIGTDLTAGKMSAQQHLIRHLRLRHKNEKDVLHALSLSKSKRNDAFAALKKMAFTTII